MSGKEGITDADEYGSYALQRPIKPIILVVNKADNPEMRNEIFDVLCAGLRRSIPSFFSPRDWYRRCSDAIVENLPNEEVAENPDMIKFSLDWPS